MGLPPRGSMLLDSVRLVRTVAALVLTVVSPFSAVAQASSGGGFSPGTRTIVDLNFASTAVGDFPKGLRLLGGNLEVVDKDGVRMLRASSPSEFVLPLPAVLPKDFTVELELIPKACCNPVDLMIEGVISGGRSPVSAQLEWDADHFAAVGGNPEMFQMDMLAPIAASLPSTLTTVAWSFEDETVKMYTNGQRVYTLVNRKFMRGQVLKISLGGQDQDKYAVYLKSVRVADMTPAIVTSNAPQAGPRSVTATTSTTSSPTRPPGTTGGPVTIMSDATAPTVTVTATAGGLKVSYTQVAGASNYTLCRESPPGGTCTTTTIGAGAEVIGNVVSHYDVGLTPGSTHAYRVTAFRPDGHFGQSAAVSGVAEPFPAPQNLRVVRVNNAPAEAIVMWDRVPYADYNGMMTVGSYLVWLDGQMLPTVSGPQVTIPILPGQATYQLEVAAAAPAPTGGKRASLSYTCRYRLVVLGLEAIRPTYDNVLNFDGAGDEAYVSTITALTDASLASPVVTTLRSSTLGDVTGFATRVQAGTVTPSGGLKEGDTYPQSLDISKPAGAHSLSFPLVIWEEAVDDQRVIIVQPSIWEDDRNPRAFDRASTTMAGMLSRSYGNHPPTLQAIQGLINTQSFGPIASPSYTACHKDIAPSQSGACVEGEDRPIGLDAYSATYFGFDNRLLVFTRAAIEKSFLARPSRQPLAGTSTFDPSAPGLIVVDFRDATFDPVLGGAFYRLLMRLERVP